MGHFVRERNWRQALNTYKELPASVQESKPAMTMRLLATQSVSDAEYLATIDDFRKRYPNDAMIDLISVDAYILRKATTRRSRRSTGSTRQSAETRISKCCAATCF